MKKRFASLITCVLCVLAVGLALAGCSGSGGSGTKASDLIGYWELTSGEAGGEELTEDDVKSMADLGVSFILYLGEDGTATIDSFGAVEDATWDADKAAMTYDGDTGDLKLSGDTLSYSMGEDTLKFKKGDDSLADKIAEDRKAQETSAEGSEAEAVSEVIDPALTIVDDDSLTITATARAMDEYDQVGFVFSITNKTDREIGLMVSDGTSTVDGTARDSYFYASTAAGETTEAFCDFQEVDSIDDLVNVRAELVAYDNSTYEDIATYEVDIP